MIYHIIYYESHIVITGNTSKRCAFIQKIKQYYTYIQAYIIGYHNPSVRITIQFLTPLMLCVLTLYMRGGIYSLKKNFEKFFIANLIFLRVFARNLLRGSHQRNIFSQSCYYRYLAWCLERGRTSDKPKHQLIDYGDYPPFFFKNEQREAITINGDCYRDMLNEFLFTK